MVSWNNPYSGTEFATPMTCRSGNRHRRNSSSAALRDVQTAATLTQSTQHTQNRWRRSWVLRRRLKRGCRTSGSRDSGWRPACPGSYSRRWWQGRQSCSDPAPWPWLAPWWAPTASCSAAGSAWGRTHAGIGSRPGHCQPRKQWGKGVSISVLNDREGDDTSGASNRTLSGE